MISAPQPCCAKAEHRVGHFKSAEVDHFWQAPTCGAMKLSGTSSMAAFEVIPEGPDHPIRCSQDCSCPKPPRTSKCHKSLQVRYQAALRPDICCFLDFKPLSQFPIPSGLPKSSQKPLDRGKTVTKPHQLGLTVSKPGRSSFAFRFNFCRASRFICSFICEYF